MADGPTLRRRFEEVLRDFFPKWRTGKTWSVTSRNKRAVSGLCEKNAKRITVVEHDPREAVNMETIQAERRRLRKEAQASH